MSGERTTAVFGGTGFLGRAVVGCLAAAGHRLRIAARQPDAVAFAELEPPPERHVVDIRDDSQVARALEGADGAVNCVSLYQEKRGLDFATIHVAGAGRIARWAQAAGVERLVHLSGIGVDAASPSAYVRSRARGEDAVREHFPAATVLRPSVLFGPDGGFLATLETVTRLPVVPLFGDGSVRLQPVHVDDVALAVLRALDNGVSGILELGGRDVVTYRALLEALLGAHRRHRMLLPVPFMVWHAIALAAGILPSPPITRDQLVLVGSDNVVASTARGFGELGIRPRGVLDAVAA